MGFLNITYYLQINQNSSLYMCNVFCFPSDIAQFLYKGEGLNKTAIGDYLGERNDFNQSVLDAFVCLHDFTDLILVQALR